MQAKAYGLWRLSAPDPDPWLEQKEELPTTGEPLGRVGVYGFDEGGGYPAGPWTKLTWYMTALDEGSLRSLGAWAEGGAKLKVGISRGSQTFSLEGVHVWLRVRKVREEFEAKHGPTSKTVFAVTVDAAYAVPIRGEVDWPKRFRELEELKKRRFVNQTYAYGEEPLASSASRKSRGARTERGE